jgi:hypothetical protein
MHIEKFIERLQGFDARGAKDFIMPLRDAKGLHVELTRLLLNLERLQTQQEPMDTSGITNIEVNGQPF